MAMLWQTWREYWYTRGYWRERATRAGCWRMAVAAAWSPTAVCMGVVW